MKLKLNEKYGCFRKFVWISFSLKNHASHSYGIHEILSLFLSLTLTQSFVHQTFRNNCAFTRQVYITIHKSFYSSFKIICISFNLSYNSFTLNHNHTQTNFFCLVSFFRKNKENRNENICVLFHLTER